MPTTYQIEPGLSADEFIGVLARSTLVGVARALTDFAYCTYLSDLAVDEQHQRQGIGRELIRLVHETAGLHTTLILLAAPKAQSYYTWRGQE